MVRSAESALERAAALRLNMDRSRKARWQVKAILNGGEEAIRALLGDKMDTSEELPWPNMLASGLNHLAQKVGHRPDPRVHPPVTTQNEKPRERAEKRQRIIEGYDEADRMELQLPQVGRWLPGYGFAVWTITSRVTPDGYLYPQAQLRDPFDCFPGEWGVDQQPDELAIHRVIPPLEAERLYPEHAGLIRGVGLGKYSKDTRSGGIVLGGSWENPSGRGLALVEYYDRDGCHILLPDIAERVDFYPNPLRSGPPFVVAKRFSFDRLNGQYDHVIGLMASIAKINIMSVIAMQDAVFAPTNIYGDLDGQYRTGRFAVNRFPPGTKVERPQQNLPYQLFEQVNRIERQFRIVAGYPVTDDGQSPINFATGAGIDELNTAVSLEVREYQKVLQWALQDLDAKRLEWDEMVSPNRRKPIIVGESADDTAVADQYTPAKDIKGAYRSERIYGVLAGWDDSAKIVGGLQLKQGKIIDRLTLQENLHGLRNLSEINERIADEEARETLLAVVTNMAQQGDPRAIDMLLAVLPEGDEKDRLVEALAPAEQPAEDPMAALMAATGGGAGGPPPDVTTVLSGLTGAGQPEGGVRTVGRLGAA